MEVGNIDRARCSSPRSKWARRCRMRNRPSRRPATRFKFVRSSDRVRGSARCPRDACTRCRVVAYMKIHALCALLATSGRSIPDLRAGWQPLWRQAATTEALVTRPTKLPERPATAPAVTPQAGIRPAQRVASLTHDGSVPNGRGSGQPGLGDCASCPSPQLGLGSLQ